MTTSTDRSGIAQHAGWVRVALGTALLLGMAGFVLFTLHWKLMVDSPIIHYANFQISQGVQPYRELQENNLPGAYLTEWFGMHVFGDGDLAWRLFEYFELAVSTACLVWIARPYDWLAGLFAGGLFTVLHGAEGPYFSGEREVAMTTLILCGYAALFLAQRRDRAIWMLPTGFALAFAAAIKPTVVLLPVLLLAVCVWQRRRALQPWVAWLVWAITGMLLAMAVNVAYLAWHHALLAFVQTQRTITVYYAHVAALTVPQMLRRFFFQPFFDILLAGGLVLAFTRRTRRWTPEQWMLLLGAGVGVLSYIAQRKNFVHHRYLYLNLGLLLIGIEIMQALRSSKVWRRWLATGLAAFVIVWAIPRSLSQTHAFHPRSDLAQQLEIDLKQLGGAETLQRRVLCLDQVFGCLNALYHLRLVENAPLSGDMLLFARSDAPVIRNARDWFWHTQQGRPADLVVLTNENFQSRNDFTRLGAWPQYRSFLQDRYHLLTEREFPCEFGKRDPEEAHRYRYRIYARVGSAFRDARLGPQPSASCP